MLGDISPQTIKITPTAVTYLGRDNVTSLNVKRFSGRSYSAVDLSLVTRLVLVFPHLDPVIVFDSATAPAGTLVWAGSDITVDLSVFAMPVSVQGCYLLAYDAEHLGGQVLVDDDDAVVEFSFRAVSATGIIQPPVLELVSEAPADDATYGRKNGTWVSIDAVVAGVSSVNGLTGTVVLGATDVGADPAGTATAAIAAHEALPDPHPQYATDTDLSNHVASTTPHAVLTGVDRLAFDQAAAVTVGVAEMAWNDVDKAVDIGLPDGVTLQVGQEVVVRGVNKSGVTLSDGTAVYISGAQGNRVVFSLADATMAAADKTIGVLTQDIANNAEGFCTIVGLIRDINTLAWAEGSELWLSAATPGALTNVKPAAPSNAVRIGFVVRSSATVGSIFVRVQVIESLGELHDVAIINPLDGNILEYDSATSTWVNVPNTGGTGETNTASNLGAGVGVFAGKVLADLQFKTLVAGAGVTLTPSATEIEIVASGAGGAVDSVNGLTGVVVLNTDHIAEDGAPVNLWFTNARASAAAPVQTVDGFTGNVVLTSTYAAASHVGAGGTAHANAIAAGAAGFMTGADKTKLDGIAAGAQVNVATDIAQGTRTSTTVPVTSSTGADATLDIATGTLAGVMSAADKTKLDGVATGANLYVHPNHSGDVTSVADGAQTIAPNAVSNTKLADMATQTIKGRTTAATGDPEDLTAAQVRTLINVADGATANSTDAALRDRTTHTGVQAISTVTGLQTALDGKTGLPAVATFTGNKTLALTDINTYNVSQDGTAQTVTVPAQATVVWTADAEIHIEQGGAGTVTITGDTDVTINGVSAGSFDMAGQFSAVTLKRVASDSWTLIGGLASDVVTGPVSASDGNLALFDGTTGKVIKDGGVVTAAGLALLDDASAPAQRTTLGVGTGDSPTFTALTLTNGQIVFPATQVPSTNANTLDDYEEGTWTPVLTFVTPGDLSVTYSSQSGTYTKVGMLISVSMVITTSTFTYSSAAGSLQITGLPMSAAIGARGALSIQGVTSGSFTWVTARVPTGGSAVDFLTSGVGVSNTTLTTSNTTSGTIVVAVASIVYGA